MNSGAGIKRLILFLGLVLGGGVFITWQLVIATTDAAEQLVVWGLWQDSSQLESIIADYQEQSGTAVKYKKIASVMTYRPELIEALAAGRGPDLFVIHHTWVDSMIDHLAPAPAKFMTAKEVASEFAPVVTTDLVRADQVYALPTSIDSLALFYNQAALASAGLKPPATWTDFLQATIRLTSTDQAGALLQSGAALGTASNVNRAPDIVQLLLLQSGLDIITEDG
ncbi:extracellular solute-binding protein, partial [Patescibacteria group bacterium]|nr:extracellular solute-binding protein [Patescibacteria group bacterium]